MPRRLFFLVLLLYPTHICWSQVSVADAVIPTISTLSSLVRRETSLIQNPAYCSAQTGLPWECDTAFPAYDSLLSLGTDAVGQYDTTAAENHDQLRVARFRNDPLPARPTNVPFSITSRPRDSTVSVAPVT